MSTGTNDLNIHSVMKERHSVRSYDTEFKISKDDLTEMIREAGSAPSSMNLQPWRVLVVTEQAKKEQLCAVSFNQKPILDASAVLVILGNIDAYKEVEKIEDAAIAAGLSSPEKKAVKIEKMMSAYESRSETQRREIVKLDCGLFSMQLMLLAKAKGYDTLPMGGYNAEGVAQLFDLPENIMPALIITIGKAKDPAYQTVRLDAEEIISWESLK